ncbi:hypothetical protein FRC01_014582, partial [Tulasnella sp. 417]
SKRFSAFLDHLFQHQDEDAEEEIPVPKKARFDHTRPTARPRSQPPRPETTAKTSAPTTQGDVHEKPVSAEPSTTSARSTPPPAPSTPNSHAASFSSLNAIQSQFDALKAAFSFPANAEFDSSSSTSDAPRLTYASVNAPIHQYENELVKLLTKLDAVESDGAESIRGARKALVIAVEKELTSLDEQKKEAWAKSLPAATETVAVDSSESEPTTEATLEAPTQEVQDASAPEVSMASEQASDAVVVAASVPLPESDDMELDTSSEPADARPIESSPEEVSPQAIPETAAPVASTSQQSAEAVAPSDNVPTNLFADTPEALADSTSENEEEEESSGEAGILVDEDSDSEVEAFIQVEESSPRVSEARLEKDEDVEDSQEPVKLPAQEQADDEDDFEML